MSKKWIALPIAILIIFMFWIMGGVDLLLARTIFAPDYDPNLVVEEENLQQPNDEELEEPFCNEKPPVNIPSVEEKSYSVLDIEYKVEIIGKGLDIPWEILPLSDGRVLVTQRPGRIVMLDNGEIYNILDVEHTGEAGLLGMAISPNFEENRQLFLYYTYKDGSQLLNRVSRFILQENTLIDETYILDRIPGSRFHNGGRLKFGPDEKLYITTGDAQNPDLSQDTSSLAGKILRINSDGTIPEDNPFENSPVFAYGLRNPQGISWHPVSGDLFASDHGPNSQDEINLILPGKNYGWPIVTCLEKDTKYEDPIACYTAFTLAPSGIDFLPWDNLDEYPLYVAGLRGNMIMRIDLNDQGGFIREESMFREYGRIRTVVYYENALYVATNNRDGRGNIGENDDMILKITPILPSK